MVTLCCVTHCGGLKAQKHSLIGYKGIVELEKFVCFNQDFSIIVVHLLMLSVIIVFHI